MFNLAAARKFEAAIAHGEIGYDADIDEPATAITVRCTTCEAPAGHRCAYRHGEVAPVHAIRAHAARNTPAAADDARGFEVACPICGAAHGNPCRDGNAETHVHMTRLAAADLAAERAPDAILTARVSEIMYGPGLMAEKCVAVAEITRRGVRVYVEYDAAGRADVVYEFEGGEPILRPTR